MIPTNETARIVLKKLFTLVDPVSLSPQERREIFSFEEFFKQDEEQLINEFMEIQHLSPPHGKDLFEFNMNVMKQHKSFMYSNLVWDKIGIPKVSIMLNVKLDETRERKQLSVVTIKIEDLEARLKEEPDHSWSKNFLSILESFEHPCVLILYTDDEHSSTHGFPFDLSLILELPNLKDESNTVKLFRNCLENGYNVLDSYQLLKLKKTDIDNALIEMIKSERFSKKQIDYVYSMIQIRNAFEDLLENGQLDKKFGKSDNKRYTEVMFQSAEPIKYRFRYFSEKGERSQSNKESPKFKFLNELAEFSLENIQQGEHQIRFFNETYMLRYNEPMWIPVLLRGGELSYPRDR